MTIKILLYGINFAPELNGIGKYTGEMAAWLAARGEVNGPALADHLDSVLDVGLNLDYI